jgi:hypothetical protein
MQALLNLQAYQTPGNLCAHVTVQVVPAQYRQPGSLTETKMLAFDLRSASPFHSPLLALAFGMKLNRK